MLLQVADRASGQARQGLAVSGQFSPQALHALRYHHPKLRQQAPDPVHHRRALNYEALASASLPSFLPLLRYGATNIGAIRRTEWPSA